MIISMSVCEILELMTKITESLEISFSKIKIEYGYGHFVCHKHGLWYKINPSTLTGCAAF